MNTDTVEKVTVTSPSPSGVVQTQSVTTKSSVSDFFVSKTNQVILSIVGILDLLIALRVVFLLLGANQVGFVSSIISITQVFVAPFAGIFPSPSAGSSYLDASAIVAIIAYLVLAVILGVILDLFSSNTETV